MLPRAAAALALLAGLTLPALPQAEPKKDAKPTPKRYAHGPDSEVQKGVPQGKVIAMPPWKSDIFAGTVRDWLSLVKENEDLVSVGAYVAGSSKRIDDALAHREAVDAFLKQPADDLVDYDSAVQSLEAL